MGHLDDPDSDINRLSGLIINSAMTVHSALGPGLLESAYEACLRHELLKRRLGVQTQVQMPVQYDGMHLDLGYRIDMIVEDLIVIELKTVEGIEKIHKAQIMSYMKLGGFELGLIINFNVVHLRDGIRRIILPSASSASSAVTQPEIGSKK
jgi:GxxExxY protein